jgi:hypothetical protein
VCPRCGSAAAVHSIQELAAMARAQLGQQAPGFPAGPQSAGPQAGYAADPQPGPPPQAGFGATPQPGPPQAGFGATPQPRPPQAGFGATPQPGSPPQPGGPLPGYAQQPRPGRPRGRIPGLRDVTPDISFDGGGSLGDDIAGAAVAGAMMAGAKFIGRRVGRKLQQKFNDQVLPTMLARQQETLRRQIEIADRHPDLCACLDDQVAFLAGGSKAVPMPNLQTVTVEQSDALVAQLSNG